MSSSSLGQRLAAVRRECRLKQQDLARKIAVSGTHVGRYERLENQPTLDVQKRMAKGLSLSLDYLVLGEKDGVAAAHLGD
ncbi:MAG: helix-turn-helix transcriptional regulator [Acidobacteria bacterium]|nr:helix-turn-helix transcriptional regulator [Acidobacteriota bacterium]MBI3658272.1 helix-turn-helix transcriptional regulator [Acidobacteriota bacterium]